MGDGEPSPLQAVAPCNDEIEQQLGAHVPTGGTHICFSCLLPCNLAGSLDGVPPAVQVSLHSATTTLMRYKSLRYFIIGAPSVSSACFPRGEATDI